MFRLLEEADASLELLSTIFRLSRQSVHMATNTMITPINVEIPIVIHISLVILPLMKCSSNIYAHITPTNIATQAAANTRATCLSAQRSDFSVLQESVLLESVLLESVM